MKFMGIIFIAVGIILFKVTKNLYHEKNDYLNYPTTTGTVLHTHDFAGQRWLVEFYDEQGRLVLGMDDVLAGSTFHPEKYHIPKSDTEEQFYYWELDRTKRSYSINGRLVEYYIHFCDEGLYELSKKKLKRSAMEGRLIGSAFIVAGLVMIIL